ncbi:MAG: hypothetical protein A2136_10695 [Chloroflexi bacterium RBG_16_54_11]|nr:MAG: hypothetical protein A2136_10695 [Chloroflexi bacterium RBG_16_54_11]
MNTNPVDESRRFLFVLFEGGGNVPPILNLAQGLIQRGHSVRVISDPINEAEVRLAGCEFTPYQRTPHRTDKFASSTLIKDYEEKDPINELKVVIDYFSSSALACAQDILEEIDARPVDLIVVHEIIFGAYFAAEKRGIPAVMVVPGIYTFPPAPGIPPPGMMPMNGLFGRVRDRIGSLLFQRVIGDVTPRLNAARHAHGLPSLPEPAQFFNRIPQILVMTSPAFDFNAQLGANVRYVGPVLDDPAWVGEWQSPWPIDDPRPLIVVSFGTTYQNQEPLIKKAINAMDGMPVRGLVTLGPAMDMNQFKVPSNVAICQSAPHQKIFPSTSGVITHAGHGTVIRALASGVPLICIPIGRDQPGNAARVVYHGAGLRLPAKASSVDIRRAIQKVIYEPKYRENARRLGNIISEEARNATGVQELERAAKSKLSIMEKQKG